MKKTALFLSIFLLSLFSFFLFLPSADAVSQAIPTQSDTATVPVNTTPDVPNNPHFSTQSTVIEIMSAITCQLSGIDPTNPKQSCLGVDQLTGKIGFLPKTGSGAIGAMGNMITMLYTPPLHTSDYFQNLAQNFGLTKHAYAQQTGSGFDGLKPLQALWTAFRNIVYLVFVIVFVVIGLAIMLRIKIDPRTVMTIQNQIPKIIIGILLVTFSFAISGFLIDIMYVSIHLIENTIVSTDPKNPSSNVSNASNPFRAIGALLKTNPIVAVPNLAWKPAESVSQPIAELFNNPPGQIVMGIIGGYLGSKVRTGAVSAVNGVIGVAKSVTAIAGIIFPGMGAVNTALGWLGNLASVAGGVGGAASATSAENIVGLSERAKTITDTVIGGVGVVAGVVASKQIFGLVISIVAFLIILIALLVALFRLWLTLLMAYVNILLSVVLAPFWIIGGIIPGSSINISGWFRNIGANLLAFPATIGMFLLGKVFMETFSTGDTANNFVPPLVGNRLDGETLGALIGLGVILITPNILNLLKTALKVPKMDTGLGKAIGVGVGIPMSAIKGAIGLKHASEEYMIMGVDPKDSSKIQYGKKPVSRAWWEGFSRH